MRVLHSRVSSLNQAVPYIISANINYRHAISRNVSIIVICINLSIILQAILY